MGPAHDPRTHVLRYSHDNAHDMFVSATCYKRDVGVSILSPAEIAACRTDGVVVPEFRLPPDRLAHSGPTPQT